MLITNCSQRAGLTHLSMHSCRRVASAMNKRPNISTTTNTTSTTTPLSPLPPSSSACSPSSAPLLSFSSSPSRPLLPFPPRPAPYSISSPCFVLFGFVSCCNPFGYFTLMELHQKPKCNRYRGGHAKSYKATKPYSHQRLLERNRCSGFRYCRR